MSLNHIFFGTPCSSIQNISGGIQDVNPTSMSPGTVSGHEDLLAVEAQLEARLDSAGGQSPVSISQDDARSLPGPRSPQYSHSSL